MTPEEARARLVMEIDAQYRAALHDVLARVPITEEERLEVAGAVVGLLLRKMYQQRGIAWLEQVIKAVLAD